MSGGDFERLGEDTLRLALLVSASLGRELAAEDGDTKRARELSAILKDMTGLARELCGQEARELTVRFIGEAEALSE